MRIPKRFVGPALLPNATATQYTVPANRRAIIRHIHFSNPTGAAVTVTMSIGADAAGTRIFDAFSIPAGTVYDHYPYYVLEAAQILAAHAGTADVLNVTVDGDEEVLA